MPTDRMGPPPGASPPMRMTASWSGLTDPTPYRFESTSLQRRVRCELDFLDYGWRRRARIPKRIGSAAACRALGIPRPPDDCPNLSQNARQEHNPRFVR